MDIEDRKRSEQARQEIEEQSKLKKPSKRLRGGQGAAGKRSYRF
jgi:hypothetical protein